MVKKGFFIFAAFAALVLASEIEDNEQKKRGAGKTNTLNAIPTGAQKPEYTYSIYTQSANAQSIPSQSYQSQVPNLFYPSSQVASQYYAPSNNPDTSTSNSLHTQVTPNINSQVAQHTQPQFIPINFIPNPGYQSKYQILSPKQSGSLQLAFVQQPAIQPSQILQYPHSFFSPSHSNLITTQNGILGSQGHFSFSPTLQPLSLGGSFLGQPSMVVLPQGHSGLYNNLVYPNPTQSFYNYYPSHSQAKYSYASGQTVSQSNDQAQSTIPQSITKDDSISAHNSEYITPSDSSSGYKNSYTRSTYSKL
ncbi:uncharacterized protein LOC120631715 [Pararge aegeria]|uniref:Jg12546 protein n=1 Tax=Pararge aegeria aegeria TaxID=348720 RepID=A0A8S4SE11_9NEOP|nr:uncharacterized protein LOC120631715 [Pararge aegeria]CAH2258796.1 jg12546 [Pararge aegeria aegeria]